MPFLTEELWHQLPQPAGARSIALDKFPEFRAHWFDPETEHLIERFQDASTTIREAKADANIDPRKWSPVEVYAHTNIGQTILNHYRATLQTTTASAINVVYNQLNPLGGIVRSNADLEVKVSFSNAVDKNAEIARLRKEIERLAKDIESKKARLADETFLNKAPAKIIDDLKATLAQRIIEHQKLLDRLGQLE